MNDRINIIDIIRGTTVDGPGLRTAIYFAGCSHHCKGCHNPGTWDFNAGRPFSLEEIIKIVNEEDFDVTLTGGDPLFHPRKIACLVEKLKERKRNIWIYTGFSWEEIINDIELKKAIEKADIVVDGPYIENLHDSDLPFRGSRNQRLIDVNASLSSGSVVELKR